jgi:urease accessory protein
MQTDAIQTGALLHLLQLASPALPIGAYSYSQGLESALETGIVVDAKSARSWIVDHLQQVLSRFEAPILWRLLRAFEARDAQAVAYWNERFIAARDSAEFRAETIQMGFSLRNLVTELVTELINELITESNNALSNELADQADNHRALLALLHGEAEVSLPCALACAGVALAVPHQALLVASLFSWAENQVLVCVKSVPLGQVAGQKLLLSLRAELELAAQCAEQLSDDALSNWAPGLSLLSMQHEVQFSRLYRS